MMNKSANNIEIIEVSQNLNNETNTKRKSLKAIGKYLSKKLSKKSTTCSKGMKIKSKYFNRQQSVRSVYSINSVQFWEEDFSNNTRRIRRRSNQTSTPIKSEQNI